MTEGNCPVCASADGWPAQITSKGGYDQNVIFCPACGWFDISRTAAEDFEGRLDAEHRRAMSHELRWLNELRTERPYVNSDWFQRAKLDENPLPSVSEQMDNALRFLGLRLKHMGREFESIRPELTSAIGSIDAVGAYRLLKAMQERGLIDAVDSSSLGGRSLTALTPTVEGWLRIGEMQRGQAAEPFAFMAMKYGDPELEAVVRDVFRPAMSEVGYGLEVIRDRPSAGLIDNYMRSRIRLCALLIADLTHANNGAYWEAGFGEGLGKPVIYTCQRAAFEANVSHFDTNHSQTIVWDGASLDEAREQLKACVTNTFASLASKLPYPNVV